MRRLVLMLVFALPLFGYEIRSSKYALSVEVVMDRYDVHITDVETKSVLVSEKLTRIDFEIAKAFDAGDRKLHLQIKESPGRLRAELRVEHAQTVIDVLNGTWLTEPYAVKSDAEGPYRVGGDVKAPVVISRVEPLYTDKAKAARISGIVIVEAVIDRNGNVTDARVLKPLPFGLDQAAVDALRQWKFRPGTLDGEPVDVIFNLTINFMPPE